MFASNQTQLFAYFVNKPVILSHIWQKICERARIISIFYKVCWCKGQKSWTSKNLHLWAEPEPDCSLKILFLLIIVLPCVILDLGDCETFSADYMEVVRFRGGFRGADYPQMWIYHGVLRYTYHRDVLYMWWDHDSPGRGKCVKNCYCSGYWSLWQDSGVIKVKSYICPFIQFISLIYSCTYPAIWWLVAWCDVSKWKYVYSVYKTSVETCVYIYQKQKLVYWNIFVGQLL